MTSASVCSHNQKISCHDCRLSKLCLPIALEHADVVKLDNIVQRGRPLQKGEYAYRAQDPFTSVFAVRSGAIKSYNLTDNGQEQVTGFYFPGEIIGMDGISKSRHASSAKALETSAICEIPFKNLGELSSKIPSLQLHFFQLMSQEIAEDQHLITLLSKNTAEERIAALLLSISVRNGKRHLSTVSLRLPMSRTDIGNYLGLTVETVSRVFSRFKKQRIIDVVQKEIEILDLPLLRKIAQVSEEESTRAS